MSICCGHHKFTILFNVNYVWIYELFKNGYFNRISFSCYGISMQMEKPWLILFPLFISYFSIFFKFFCSLCKAHQILFNENQPINENHELTKFSNVFDCKKHCNQFSKDASQITEHVLYYWKNWRIPYEYDKIDMDQRSMIQLR